MSDVALALHNQLATYPALAELISGRVYPVQLPLSPTLPATTYQRISNATIKHRGNRRPTYGRPRFQIDGWASTYKDAQALRAVIMDAMGDFSRASNPRVDVALHQDDRDIIEAVPGRWRTSLDYFIFATES